MKNKQKKEEESIHKCELCGKDAMGYSNFCMCNECFDKPSTQRALFRI